MTLFPIYPQNATLQFSWSNAAATYTDNVVEYSATSPTVTINQKSPQSDPTSLPK